MRPSDPLPSLFGRFTAISDEHEHLLTTLRRLADICTAIDSDERELVTELQPRRVIAELSTYLQHHFQIEEAPEYFGAVAAERPALVTRIADLRAEHTALLERAARVQSLGDEWLWQDFAPAARELIEALRAHERLESALLDEFFSRDD
jgi:hypothetical protein